MEIVRQERSTKSAPDAAPPGATSGEHDSFYSVAAAYNMSRACPQGLNGRRGWAVLRCDAHERPYLRSSFAPLIWSIAAETARSICG
jgi:hypothetical protein